MNAAKNCQSPYIALSSGSVPRRAGGLKSGPDPEPSRNDLAGLGPAEHPGYGPESFKARSGTRAACGARADVHVRQLLHRRRLLEIVDETRRLEQFPVGLERSLRHEFHDRVPAVRLGPFVAGCAVRQRRFQHCRQGQVEVALGQPGQSVLVGYDLALLGDLDRTVDDPGRLGEDRRIGRAAATSDSAPHDRGTR